MTPKDVLTVEAILFAAGTRITAARIAQLSQIDEKAVAQILQQLSQKYESEDSPYSLTTMGEDWKLTVKSQYLPIVEKIAPDTELSKSVIETLAMIAWKSPMIQSDIVKVRSNKAYDHIEELKNRGFIVKERKGRSYIIKLTPKFFEYFDLSDKKQVDSLFKKYKEDAALPQKKVDEFEKKEEKIQLPIPAPENQITIPQIKSEEKKTQKEFFEKIESGLLNVSANTSKIQDEIKKMMPPEEPPQTEQKESQ